MIKLGDKVKYKGEIYEVIHLYDTGMMEIKKENSYIVELVTESQIEFDKV
ncbi:hypothetical protein [Bacillus sp. FJAT-27231]|nr:hypothetical protein [Bacillus sp. FJAT-27231]